MVVSHLIMVIVPVISGRWDMFLAIDFKQYLLRARQHRLLLLILSIIIILYPWIGLLFTNNSNLVTPFHSEVVTMQKPAQNLLEMPVFGYYLPENVQNSGVKKTSLNITLLGILLADDENQSAIIVSKNNGEELILHPGESINGAIVKRITSDGVILLNHGLLEKISLPREKLHFSAPDRLFKN